MTDKPEQTREAAGKGTKEIGQILFDLQLEAEGKFEKAEGHAQDKPGRAEHKLEGDG